MNNKSNFNIFSKKITGNIFIEASAGTGKTFTIIMLYLRFLLGINLKKKKPFKIQDILVVTFTKNATLELKERIRENIFKLKYILMNNIETKKFKLFLKKIKNINKSIKLLKKAEENIDQIAIYTIHSFCKKILENYKYKYPIKKNKILIKENKEIYLKSISIFWNKYFSTLPINLIKIITEYWKNPRQLFTEIYPVLQKEYKKIKNLKKKKISLIEKHIKIIKNIKKIKKNWIKIYKHIKRKIIKKNREKHTILFKKINKITEWAYNPTNNYNFPKELKYFKRKNTHKKKIQEKIERKIIMFINSYKKKKNIDIKKNLLILVFTKIPKIIKKQKKQYIEHEDLITDFYKKICKNKKLLRFLQKKHPIGFIDEFQDTDQKQYKIFKKIYNIKKTYLLLFIGDPKQTIYNFRGIKILKYFKKKKEKKIRLIKNWRSTSKMNNTINFIFKRMKNPFILKEIKFKKTKTPKCNLTSIFKVKKKEISSLNIVINEKIINLHKYKIWAAKQCANIISKWLYHSQKNNTLIKFKKINRSIVANDITILVNNKYEARIIKNQLNSLNIPSVFNPNKKNIYKTKEAEEMLFICQSILEPENFKKFNRAISTNILTKNFNKLQKFKIKKKILEKFNKYNILWKKIGIFSVFWKIIKDFKIDEKYSYFNKQKPNMENIINIGKIIQKKSKYNFNRYSLISWFSKKIYDKNIKKKKKKYLINKNYVKITTIHMSKGMEYLITFIPFSMNFKKQKKNTFYIKKNKLIIKKKEKQSKKNLSESIRLLYVALTRSIIHCSIFIAPIINSLQKFKKKKTLDSHKSSIGFLIQKGKKCSLKKYIKKVNTLKKNKNIQILNNKIIPKKILIIKEKRKRYYKIKEKFKKKYKNNTSYTEITKEKKKKHITIKRQKKIKKTTYTFPTGKNTGLFFHEILKKIKFYKPIDIKQIKKIMKKYQISKNWLKTLKKWIYIILNSHLNKEQLTLSKLKKEQHIKEMEFNIYIKKILKTEKINNIIKKIDKISKISPNLKFIKIKGILIGKIDLIFFFKKKYYIIDYKTNWLGKSNKNYKIKKIKENIIKYRYDLQYQIYSLALHKYLKSRMKKYKFKKNFGGVYYLYLRSINDKYNLNNIFYTLPKKKLIKKLNKLFKK